MMDLLIVGVCLVAGYWLVGLLLGRGSPRADARTSESSGPGPGPGADRDDAAGAAVDPPVATAGVTLRNWFVVLGVAESAGKDEIVAAYRRLVSQYHPDKVAGLGAELGALANEKTKQINAAYELGMRRFR